MTKTQDIPTSPPPQPPPAHRHRPPIATARPGVRSVPLASELDDADPCCNYNWITSGTAFPRLCLMGAGTMVRFLGGIERVESTPHVPGFFVRYGRFGTARRSRFESLVNKGFRYRTDFLPILLPCNERHSFPSCRLCQHPFAFFFVLILILQLRVVTSSN